jgi:hypothetical protein
MRQTRKGSRLVSKLRYIAHVLEECKPVLFHATILISIVLALSNLVYFEVDGFRKKLNSGNAAPVTDLASKYRQS